MKVKEENRGRSAKEKTACSSFLPRGLLQQQGVSERLNGAQRIDLSHFFAVK